MNLKTLQKLKQDSEELNIYLQDLNKSLDCHINNLEGIKDISSRVRKAFSLYRDLVAEIDSHNTEGDN